MVEKWADGSGRVRVGKRTIDLLLGNADDVSEWDDEELVRGCRRYKRKDGKMVFPGTPHVIPLRVYQELVKRMMMRAQHRFAAELEVAVNEHIKIITARRVPHSVKLQAISMLYDRVMGKPTEHIAVSTEDEPWRKMIAAAIVPTGKDAEDFKDDDIIDGEVVEDEGEEEPGKS